MQSSFRDVRSLAAVAIWVALAAPAAAAPPRSADAPIRTVNAGQGKIGYRSVLVMACWGPWTAARPASSTRSRRAGG
jgi:hypothetical protein